MGIGIGIGTHSQHVFATAGWADSHPRDGHQCQQRLWGCGGGRPGVSGKPGVSSGPRGELCPWLQPTQPCEASFPPAAAAGFRSRGSTEVPTITSTRSHPRDHAMLASMGAVLAERCQCTSCSCMSKHCCGCTGLAASGAAATCQAGQIRRWVLSRLGPEWTVAEERRRDYSSRNSRQAICESAFSSSLFRLLPRSVHARAQHCIRCWISKCGQITAIYQPAYCAFPVL